MTFDDRRYNWECPPVTADRRGPADSRNTSRFNADCFFPNRVGSARNQA